MTTNEMVQAVRDKIESPLTSVYSDVEVIRYLNDAYRAIVNIMDSFDYYYYVKSSSSLTFVNITRTYTLPALRRLLKVVDLTTNTEYRETDPRNHPEWCSDYDRRFYIDVPNSQLKLFQDPYPGTYTLFLVENLETLAAAGVGPLQVPLNYHRLVVDHTVKLMKQTETSEYASWMQEVERQVQSMQQRPGVSYVRVTDYNAYY